MISVETYNHDYEVAYKYGYQQGKKDAIDFVVKQIIYPLLNEYDIQLWKDIEYIELAEKWVELVGKYKGDDESKINELSKWILEQLKGQK